MSESNSESNQAGMSRRELLKNTGRVAAVTALAGVAVPSVHASGTGTIQLALVGCGGRGTGAAANAMSVQTGPTKLVAMADVFDDRLSRSYKALSGRYSNKMDVPEDHKFIGFDAYRKAMDCLNPGDVVLLTTPPAFRWVHFTYAIEKGLNVFMEKPIAVDGPAARRMFALGEEAKKKNLKVGVGLMCRHCHARGELYKRIQDGQIGDILELRAYRMAGPTGSAASGPNPGPLTDLMYQIRRFHSFLWASGGAYSDFLIHNIDESCWMKNAWPVKADGSGGRHFRGKDIDQNFDHYSVEYTFGDGSKLFLRGRTIPGCYQQFASYAHGTKGAAVISTAAHTPSKARIYSSLDYAKDKLTWAFPQPEPNPYQLEWEDLTNAIRQNQPYNEIQRGAEASLVTAMGRMAAHTGQEITRDQMLNCEHEFAPQVAELTLDADAPLQLRDDGTYPVPLPGITKTREF